jgi:hypothetical protein
MLGMTSECKLTSTPLTSSSTAQEMSAKSSELSLSKLSECPICRCQFDPKLKNSFSVGLHLAEQHFAEEINAQLGLSANQPNRQVFYYFFFSGLGSEPWIFLVDFNVFLLTLPMSYNGFQAGASGLSAAAHNVE